MCAYGRGLAGRRPAGTGGKRQAADRNRRLGRRRGVAYDARGYKQGWADKRAGRRASRRPKSSQNHAFWLVGLIPGRHLV